MSTSSPINELIEVYSHRGEGYNPYLIGDLWQVAQLNFLPEHAVDAIHKLDVHYETDETFLLLDGRAVLIAASIADDLVEYELIDMQPKVLYNIPRNCWHNIAMSEDAEVLITENARTHEGDYEFYFLSEAQKEELCRRITSIWNGE